MVNSEIPVTPNALKNSYRYLRLLGEGSNGKTYLAIQIHTGIQVAIKTLKLDNINSFKSLELFKREAAILSSINLEGVPRFYESIFPEDSNTTCYIIQEYVEAPSLQSILNDLGKLDEKNTLLILEKMGILLSELQTLYSPPIIHRDIKPSNILCYKDPSENVHLYLIDFGAVANPQRRSGSSTIAGTFGYMAPEQMLGDICIQSDYYSLGATCLHILTGVPPYMLDTVGFKIDYPSILQKYAPETSNAMISLLESLLAPEIDKRPANAQQLLSFIHNVQKGKCVSVTSLDEELPVVNYETSTSKRNKFLRKNLLPKNMQPVITTSEWTKRNGIVRVKRTLLTNKDKIALCYEYTFEVNHRTYVGEYFGPLNFGDKKDTIRPEDLKLPIECELIFNPENPRMNQLIKLIKPNKNDSLTSASHHPGNE